MNRYLNATYCDDVRQEANGKTILIGVYSGDMIVRSYPITLPQFFVLIKAVSPARKPFSELSVKLYQDDKLISEVAADSDDLTKLAQKFAAESVDEPGEAHDGTESVEVIRMQAVIKNFMIESDCTIHVVAQTESEAIRTTPLVVRKAAQSVGTA